MKASTPNMSLSDISVRSFITRVLLISTLFLDSIFVAGMLYLAPDLGMPYELAIVFPAMIGLNVFFGVHTARRFFKS